MFVGTVTGMIEVFQVMAFTGGGDARSWQRRIKATLPTMAGMTTALSGVFAQIYLNSAKSREELFVKEIIKNLKGKKLEKKRNFNGSSRRR